MVWYNRVQRHRYLCLFNATHSALRNPYPGIPNQMLIYVVRLLWWYLVRIFLLPWRHLHASILFRNSLYPSRN